MFLVSSDISGRYYIHINALERNVSVYNKIYYLQTLSINTSIHT
jgi:hypothetical protein